MAQNVEVKCINKTDRSDPHERIKNIGGVNPNGSRWRMSVPDAIVAIEQGKYSFYVAAGGKSVWVVIAQHNGRKYLKTEPDGIHPNNLLALPECP
ncbi:DUF3892 domain-containing protein [Chromobacterium vaccinii]|uniref:DUF3892 domain-containing protein n=1 Tax=Chromobacterium vaccinii TaxID=1108595 RepID=UPI001E2AAF2A|nr:DUF3892 domain-containing protein [Chromobacterium vaccinii]MCD4485526.1 DUF3892 domain-containing protein [Chromobacterium vaccinii]